MGAGVSLHAATIAEQFDITVRGLVLIIPPTFGDDRQNFAPMYMDWARIINEDGLSQLVKHWRKRPATKFFEREFPEAREICFADFLNRDPRSMAAVFQAAAISDIPDHDRLKNISCPVQILARTDDELHPTKAAEDLSDLLHCETLTVARHADEVHDWPNQINNFIAQL